MKITINKDVLIKSLSRVQNIVERNNKAPVLNNILIEANDNKLKFTSTDSDIMIEEICEANIESEGSITAPAHMFYEMVRKFNSGNPINISLKKKQLIINSGATEVNLSTLPVEQFPILSAKDFDCEIYIPAVQLSGLINKTKFAMSDDQSKHALNGIYLHSSEGKLKAAATDAHRLANIAIDESFDAVPDIIIPRKTVVELSKILENYTDKIKISISQTKIAFEFNNLKIISKLVDGKYPDYERAIPTNNDKKLSVDVKQFASAIDRVCTVSYDKQRTVKLDIENDNILISSSGGEKGTARESLQTSYSDDQISTSYNGRYLIDILNQITSSVVDIYFDNANSPAIIKDRDFENALYILMPIRG